MTKSSVTYCLSVVTRVVMERIREKRGGEGREKREERGERRGEGRKERRKGRRNGMRKGQ